MERMNVLVFVRKWANDTTLAKNFPRSFLDYPARSTGCKAVQRVNPHRPTCYLYVLCAAV